MLPALRPLAKYLKIKPVRIYDAIFILHSKLTVAILLACSFLVSAKQFFGDPIHCKTDEKATDVINNYCWTMGTYIDDIDDDIQIKKRIGTDLISWGVTAIRSPVEHPKIFLRYYQWVVLVLILQALAFSIPSIFWKNWEGGRLQQLCEELGCAIFDHDFCESKKRSLVEYFNADNKDIHMFYAIKYIFCEFLNFIICILNIFAMNLIFNNFFFAYAPAIHHLTLNNNWDLWNFYTSKLFPKMAHCDFYTYGPTGDVNKIDALCILPLNILNEKIFAFLWIWFIMLTLLSGLNILYRILFICCQRLRLQLIRSQVRFMTTEDLRRALMKYNFGDCFVLYKISGNINPTIYRNLIEDINESHKKRNDKLHV